MKHPNGILERRNVSITVRERIGDDRPGCDVIGMRVSPIREIDLYRTRLLQELRNATGCRCRVFAEMRIGIIEQNDVLGADAESLRGRCDFRFA